MTLTPRQAREEFYIVKHNLHKLVDLKTQLEQTNYMPDRAVIELRIHELELDVTERHKENGYALAKIGEEGRW